MIGGVVADQKNRGRRGAGDEIRFDQKREQAECDRRQHAGEHDRDERIIGKPFHDEDISVAPGLSEGTLANRESGMNFRIFGC